MSSTYSLPYRGLPPEIRLKIWHYCLRKTLCYRRHNDHLKGPILANTSERINVAILRLDKKTHEEAKEVMVQSVWLNFLDTSLEEIVRLLQRISPGLRLGHHPPIIPNRTRLDIIQGISVSLNVAPVDGERFLYLIGDSPIEHLIIRKRAIRRHRNRRLSMSQHSFISSDGTDLMNTLYRTGALKSLGFEICGFTQGELGRYKKNLLDSFEEWAGRADLSMSYEPSWDPEGENLLLTFVKN